jgi:hypothetical protein
MKERKEGRKKEKEKQKKDGLQAGKGIYSHYD